MYDNFDVEKEKSFVSVIIQFLQLTIKALSIYCAII